jgi:predicted KAP-like P-loop ATPase
VGVDEAALAKMLLFERCGSPKVYAALAKAVSEDEGGKPGFLAKWEQDAAVGKAQSLSEPWDDPFMEEWLSLPPSLADQDLRGILYVSREHAPLIMPEDRLSSEGAELLTALAENPGMARSLKSRLEAIPRNEISVIMDRLLQRAGKEQEWGVPDILEALIVVAETDPVQGSRVAAFLSERPTSQIKPSIVPKISDRAWSGAILEKWESSAGVSTSVKKAIKAK